MSVAEQVATHLRRELEAGGFRGVMPGVLQLETELGVNRKTVEEALRQLEAEGLLVRKGTGRRREIVGTDEAAPALRLAILVGEQADRRLGYMVEILHELIDAGHAAVIARKTMDDFDMDERRIENMVAETNADAWVVLAGSHKLLEWFEGGKMPTFALFGRRRDKRIAGAGPDKRAAYVEATRRLAELGHRRIVLLARPRRVKPHPGRPEKAFLHEMAMHGLPVSAYNLPDWDETPAGFRSRLEQLFRVTPPTALILDEAPFFFATLQFLAQKRLRVPEDVSLVCTDESPDFVWGQPTVARISWDSRPLIRRVLKWAANVSKGKEDLRQTETPARFVSGGTIGPVVRKLQPSTSKL